MLDTPRFLHPLLSPPPPPPRYINSPRSLDFAPYLERRGRSRWNGVDMLTIPPSPAPAPVSTSASPPYPQNGLVVACPWPRCRVASLGTPFCPRHQCFHRRPCVAFGPVGFNSFQSVPRDDGRLPSSIRAFQFHAGCCNTALADGGTLPIRPSRVVSPSRREPRFNGRDVALGDGGTLSIRATRVVSPPGREPWFNGCNVALGDGVIPSIRASRVSPLRRESSFNGHKTVLGSRGLLLMRVPKASLSRREFVFNGHSRVLDDGGIPSGRASRESLSRRAFRFNGCNTALDSGDLPFIQVSRVSPLRKTFRFNGSSMVLGDGGHLPSRRRESRFNGCNAVLENGALPSRRVSRFSLSRRAFRFNGRLGLQLSRRVSRFHCRHIVSLDSFLPSLKPEVLLSPHSLTLDISYLPLSSSSSSRGVFAFSEEARFVPHSRPGGCLMNCRLNAQSEQPPTPSKPGWLRKFLMQPIPYNSYIGDSDEIEDAIENLSPDLDEDELTDVFDELNNEDMMDPPPPPPPPRSPPPRSVPPEERFSREAKERRNFDSWERRQEAISELRRNQQSRRSPDNKDWEDWLDDRWEDTTYTMGPKGGSWYYSQSEWEKGGLPRNPPKMPERGMNRTIKEFLLRIFEKQEEVEDDLQFEERVFRFTSQSTAKFVAILILVPWLVGYLAHDYAVVPFLNRYVEKVPLAARVLDLRESQKLGMIKSLKLERQRVRFEAAIGMAPPLSDKELAEHIKHEAKELQEEIRLENRRAFANIWSDLLAGTTLLMLLVFNPNQVAIMRITGDRIFTNVSDTGKAFIIILLSDIFLGYHSETGWETLVDIFLEHYGFEVSRASIYIFVAIVPVTIDAIFKLWVFRYLTRLSPSAAATFREMKRH